MKLIIILLLNFFIFDSFSYSKDITGFPTVIDADTIRIGKLKIRLEGIDAPELKQVCEKNNQKYFCGKVSKVKLQEKIGKKKVSCILTSKDKYLRYLGVCYVEKINLNKWLVRYGHAVAYRRYSKAYVKDEKFAKDNSLGLWSGSFIQPEKWRKKN